MAGSKLTLISALVLLCQVLFSAELTDKQAAFLADAERSMSRIKTLYADFTQIRALKLLKHKVKFNGRFFLQAPDKIAWQVHSPIRYCCIISDNSISQWDSDSDRETVISAKDNSALRVLFEQLHYWFAGKFNSLRKEFDCTVDAGKKTLVFTPKKGFPQSRFIMRISVFLQDDLSCIKQIEVVEKNGDTQTITFSNTVINQELPADAWKTSAK